MRCCARAGAGDSRLPAPSRTESGLGRTAGACVVQNANMGQQLVGGNSSWCPEVESLDHAHRGCGERGGRRLERLEPRGRRPVLLLVVVPGRRRLACIRPPGDKRMDTTRGVILRGQGARRSAHRRTPLGGGRGCPPAGWLRRPARPRHGPADAVWRCAGTAHRRLLSGRPRHPSQPTASTVGAEW